MAYSKILLIITILSISLIPPSFSDLAADRSALLRLQTAVRGRTLFWNTTNSTPCSWTGVTCDNTTNRVTALRLPGSSLTGQLPMNSIGNLTELRGLSLRGNSLSGPIPSDLASCTQLQDLHLQGNSFNQIPDSFFSLRNLLRVNLGRNNFSGVFPSGFNDLTRLRILYLEINQFAGSLPELSRLTELRRFNVSFNNGVTGSIPSSLDQFNPQSFIGTSLCGRPLVSCSINNENQLSAGAIAGISVGSFVLFLLILVILVISWRNYIRRAISPVQFRLSRSNNSSISEKLQSDEKLGVSIMKNGGENGLVFFGEEGFGLRELLSASAEVMGKGTIGSTYKAYLENGIEVIVKRLKNVCVSENEFRVTIEEFGKLIHENLGSVRGYVCGGDEKILLYDTMANGSLSALLHGNNKKPLSWEIRVNIALGVARGIKYLHSISPTTSHGNIKSSNIFLTGYFEPQLSEFGLTQLVSPLSDTNGYRAPEVTNSRTISQMADVYSFGIVILELLTGKEPTEALMEEGVGFPNWVQSIVQDKWMVEVFDPELLRYENHEEKMVQLLNIGISCTAHNPNKRHDIVKITQLLKEIIG